MVEFCVLGNKAGGPPLISRNPSATALILSRRREVLLFDCAEGTQVQLLRAKIPRSTISKIFISHLHIDHVLGLIGLLATYSTERRKSELIVYGPAGLEQWISVSLHSMDLHLRFPLTIVELEQDFSGCIWESEYYRVFAAPLEHRIPSFGFRWEEIVVPNIDIQKVRELGIPEGKLIGQLKREGKIVLEEGKSVTLEQVSFPPKPPRSFVYCCDTRPCPSAISLASGATVLLHEATYTNEHQQKAIEYYHSTAAEAAMVAKEAGVEKLYLTHISIRYKRFQTILREAREIFPEAEIARQLLRIPISSMRARKTVSPITQSGE